MHHRMWNMLTQVESKSKMKQWCLGKLYSSRVGTTLLLIIIKIYCRIQRALHGELECSLALTRIVPIYTIK